MNDLVTTNFDEFSLKIDEAIDAIDRLDDKEQLKTAEKQIRLLREWAKMNGKITDLREKILWLELKALRKIGMLPIEEASKILYGTKLNAALFFAKLNDDELTELRDTYKTAITAGQIITEWKKEEKRKKEKEEGELFASGNIYSNNSYTGKSSVPSLNSWYEQQHTSDDTHKRHHVKKIRDSLNVLLDEYTFSGKTFTVEEMTHSVLKEHKFKLGVDNIDDAFIEGIKEVCRRAIRDERIDFFETRGLPRFVTVTSRKGFVRIPFEKANKTQIREFLALRLKQAEELSAVVEKIAGVIADLDEIGADDVQPIENFMREVYEKRYEERENND